MKIDIDGLDEMELIALNNRVVERLKFLHQMRAHPQMLDFRIGQRVSFQPEGRATLSGVVTKYNRKTVTVITDGGEQWNISPTFLRASEASAALALTLLRKSGQVDHPVFRSLVSSNFAGLTYQIVE